MHTLLNCMCISIIEETVTRCVQKSKMQCGNSLHKFTLDKNCLTQLAKNIYTENKHAMNENMYVMLNLNEQKPFLTICSIYHVRFKNQRKIGLLFKIWLT